MTLTQELRARLSARGKLVGLHTAMLELREAADAAVTSLGGSDTVCQREDAAHTEGVAEGLHDVEQRVTEAREEAREPLAAMSSWGMSN